MTTKHHQNQQGGDPSLSKKTLNGEENNVKPGLESLEWTILCRDCNVGRFYNQTGAQCTFCGAEKDHKLFITKHIDFVMFELRYMKTVVKMKTETNSPCIVDTADYIERQLTALHVFATPEHPRALHERLYLLRLWARLKNGDKVKQQSREFLRALLRLDENDLNKHPEWSRELVKLIQSYIVHAKGYAPRDVANVLDIVAKLNLI